MSAFKSIRALMFGAFALAGLQGTALAEATWDMPTPYPTTNFHTENNQQFADEVAAATGGALKITLHPGGSLYKGPEIKRAVQAGQAQIGELLISSLANEDEMYALDTVPFLATSYAEAAALWTASRSAVESRLAKHGLKLLYAVPWPPQGIYTKDAVDSLADFKNMKIRSYSPTVARMIELMGGQPVTVQMADLTQALATGVVTANITSSSTGYDSKSWEQLSHYYDVQAWLPKNMVFVSQEVFDGLDEATRDAVLKAAADAETRGWKISEEKTAWYVDQLKQNGMEVVKASEGMRAELLKVGETMTNEWLDRAGDDGKAVLDAYRAAK